MNYEKICKEVCQLVTETGNFIRMEREKFTSATIEVKGVHNFVTHVDRGSEKLLVKGLSTIVPEAGFVVEEQTSEKKGDIFNWVVDPLDGTTNFIHGAPPYAISVALMEGDKVVVGVVLEVFSRELFYAWQNSQTYLNGQVVRVSAAPRVKDALLATGFPYTEFGHIDAYMKTMTHFMRHSHGLRRLGSAATDLAYVACGRYDGFYEYGLHPWDVAAGALLVERAGGMNTDFSGGKNYIFGPEIVSANGFLHNELQATIGELMA